MAVMTKQKVTKHTTETRAGHFLVAMYSLKAKAKQILTQVFI